MHYGIVMFATHYAIRPDELARAVEARGFESLWVPEHTHIPASRRSPWPGGADLPKEYWHSYDPFVALAMAAGATTKLRLGTGICLVIERDPITLAKEVASLDHLSGGALGDGLEDNIHDAYRFLVGNYEPGDELFLFGFSRAPADSYASRLA